MNHLESISKLRQGSQGTLASGQRLDCKSEAGNHSKAAVLDFCLLQAECTLWIFRARQVQGIESSPWIASLFRVSGGVAEELNATHEHRVGHSQLVNVEGQVEVDVLGLGVFQGNGVLPCDASGSLSGEDTEGTQHSPAAVHELTFAEALQAEDLGVGGKGVGGDLVRYGAERTDDLARLVYGSVLVKLVEIDLEVLSGLGQTKRVEATVTGEGAIEPCGAGGAGEPQSFACKSMR